MKLDIRDLGELSIVAAEVAAGSVYPPHTMRKLARGYIELLDRIQAYRDAHTSLFELPCSVVLPESVRSELPRAKRCQHGTLIDTRTGAGRRQMCIACHWMEQGIVDAAYVLCPHDANAATCRRCDP